jgi:3-phosphoshikimate 1-carboxyvinyltransferase
VNYELPEVSGQIKSALLIAGMLGQGKTTFSERVPTRDHMERLLSHFGVTWRREGDTLSVYGGQCPEPKDIVIPGDLSSAAFWMVAVAAVPGAQIILRNIGLNPTRTGVLSVLLRMGVQIRTSESILDGEPRGNVVVVGTDLNATTIAGTEIPGLLDELPILAVAAALARGNTLITDAGELRNREIDRISSITDNLRRMGVPVVEHPDGIEIHGGAKLKGAVIDSFGDHRIAMAFAIAGLHADGTTTIKDSECIATSYPGFEQVLNRFTGAQKNDSATIPVVGHMPKKMGIETLNDEDI